MAQVQIANFTVILHLKNTNKIIYILMQERIAGAILSLRTNVAILVNVTPSRTYLLK